MSLNANIGVKPFPLSRLALGTRAFEESFRAFLTEIFQEFFVRNYTMWKRDEREDNENLNFSAAFRYSSDFSEKRKKINKKQHNWCVFRAPAVLSGRSLGTAGDHLTVF